MYIKWHVTAKILKMYTYCTNSAFELITEKLAFICQYRKQGNNNVTKDHPLLASTACLCTNIIMHDHTLSNIVSDVFQVSLNYPPEDRERKEEEREEKKETKIRRKGERRKRRVKKDEEDKMKRKKKINNNQEENEEEYEARKGGGGRKITTRPRKTKRVK